MASSFDEERPAPEYDRLAKLAANVVLRLPSCPDELVRRALQDVYRDFCRRSCCLSGVFRAEVSGCGVVPVPPTVGGVVDCVSGASLDGRALVRGRDYAVRDGHPPAVELARRLVPAPGERPAELEVRTVEVPSLSSEDVPFGFCDRYGEWLCDGALARLQSMGARPWTDEGSASLALARYEAGVCETRMRVLSGAACGDGQVDFLPDTAVLV